jgi:hypothetical protein
MPESEHTSSIEKRRLEAKRSYSKYRLIVAQSFNECDNLMHTISHLRVSSFYQTA